MCHHTLIWHVPHPNLAQVRLANMMLSHMGRLLIKVCGPPFAAHYRTIADHTTPKSRSKPVSNHLDLRATV